MPSIDIIDLYHLDKEPDFGTLKAQGVKGVILKASEGATHRDDAFEGWLSRAMEVFGPTMVHAYHKLTADDPKTQVANFLEASANCPHRWLDYEKNEIDPNNTPTLGQAVVACHILANKQSKFPGMYGSDGDLLGEALLSGHFTVCPLWIARYGTTAPMHKCHLWQWCEADANHVYDSSVYLGTDARTLPAFMASV